MSRLPERRSPLRTSYRRWRGDLERDVGDPFPRREQHLVRRTSGSRHDVARANGLARRTARGTASPFTRGALRRAFLYATGEDRRASGLDDEDVRPRVVALEASGCVAMCERVREVRAASSCAVRDAPGVSESPSCLSRCACTTSAGAVAPRCAERVLVAASRRRRTRRQNIMGSLTVRDRV